MATLKLRYKECVKECDTNIYEYLIEVNGYIDTWVFRCSHVSCWIGKQISKNYRLAIAL